MKTTPLILCQHLYKSYQLGKIVVPALHDINLNIARGEYIAILGPSGSGKSTLMNLLGCLDTPTSGEYYLDGHDVSSLSPDNLSTIRNQQIGFIFQNFNLLAHSSALDNVALPLLYRNIEVHERKERSFEMLKRVGLGNRTHHLPNELSGGQRQRVAIARALITNPNVILADEPTGNLDSHTGSEIIAMFENLAAQGKTIIIVTHDNTLANRTHRIIEIRDGMIKI